MQLTEKIHLLRHNFEIKLEDGTKIPRFVNSLVILGDEITLVDTGVKDSWKDILQYLKFRDRHPDEIKTIILSHSHPDHIGSASKLKEMTGCKVLAHADEKDWIEDIDKQYNRRPVPGFCDLVDKPVAIDSFVEHNQVLKLAEGLTIKIFHRPGHSKGLINLLFVEDSILFTADSILLKNSLPNYEDYRYLKDSLFKIRNQKNIRVLLSSWASPFLDKEQIENLFVEAEDYLKQIDKFVHINYTGGVEKILEHCARVIKDLNLPDAYVNTIVDRAFRSHLDR